MNSGIEHVQKAIEIIENPDNCVLVDDEDGKPAFAYNGYGIDASLLLYIFQEGIRDGYITADINPNWPRLNYWNKLVDALQ